MHALRPVFRELGHPAAFVYEALEHYRGRPERSFDLVTLGNLTCSSCRNASSVLTPS
jgi:hypothetical protein